MEPLEQVRVRVAVEADCVALAAMRLRLQELLERENSSMWRMTSARRAALPHFYAESISDPDVCVLAAELTHSPGAGLVGTAIGRIEASRDVPRYGSIEDVWVEPEQRGRRICRLLMRELVVFFGARGVSELSLGFASGGSAASVWQGLGFAPAVVIANGTLDALRQRTR